ncbi:MAG TPA: rod shape-determining protein MreC [Candidatus Atopostipes pullistercoris]|uniref:Cell shape-determining protein MreC n=1 Tax=Candidatus Atopostipes pullistercoris TaxID=2838467 RepID=A0A9D2JWV9_9LACT|nr:rod shape-determining protein MreC [Candidatus Atopostipes pullistercoris]
MKQYFNNKKLITLLVSLMFFIGILWFSFNNFGSAPYLQQVVNDITSVAGRVVSKPINALNGLFSDINNLQNTFEENKELKSKLNELAEMQAELTTVTNENQKLQEELELQATLTDYNTISGTVIARNPDKWIDQVIIDRGSRDGLVNGMSVMSNNGLIGRVVEVNPTSSKVTLLTTNDEAAVYTSAEIALEDEILFGVINGYDTNRKALVMEQITSTATIEEGAEVISSGLGGLVPRGLLIGTVSEVSLDRHGLGQRVYIEPATDFEDIRFVTIINREAETVDELNDSADTEEESE